MKRSRREFLSGLSAAWWAAGGPGCAAGPEPLRFRVAADGWGKAGVAEVEAVLKSAAAALWRHFPDLRLEPFVVLRGREGPIVHYQRNLMGEIVMKLDTEDYLWCQFVYQFSHEFCHLLCGFREEPNRNRWFEETLCEVASLFVLRRLARTWEADPPWPEWKDYAPEFRRYAQDIMDSRSQVGDGHLGDFYRKHRSTLEATPRDRALNGAMALPLLALLEGSPDSWESVAWLNRSPAQPEDSLADCLQRWRAAVPAAHRGFVEEVMRRFALDPALRSGPAGGNSRD